MSTALIVTVEPGPFEQIFNLTLPVAAVALAFLVLVLALWLLNRCMKP